MWFKIGDKYILLYWFREKLVYASITYSYMYPSKYRTNNTTLA